MALPSNKKRLKKEKKKTKRKKVLAKKNRAAFTSPPPPVDSFTPLDSDWKEDDFSYYQAVAPYVISGLYETYTDEDHEHDGDVCLVGNAEYLITGRLRTLALDLKTEHHWPSEREAEVFCFHAWNLHQLGPEFKKPIFDAIKEGLFIFEGDEQAELLLSANEALSYVLSLFESDSICLKLPVLLLSIEIKEYDYGTSEILNVEHCARVGEKANLLTYAKEASEDMANYGGMTSVNKELIGKILSEQGRVQEVKQTRYLADVGLKEALDFVNSIEQAGSGLDIDDYNKLSEDERISKVFGIDTINGDDDPNDPQLPAVTSSYQPIINAVSKVSTRKLIELHTYWPRIYGLL